MCLFAYTTVVVSFLGMIQCLFGHKLPVAHNNYAYERESWDPVIKFWFPPNLRCDHI